MTGVTETKPSKKRPRRVACGSKPEATISAIPTASPPVAKAPTKAAQVEALLLREGGASLDDLRRATCWQPHTCRAFLTGLRKKERVLNKAKREDGVTIYRISSLQVVA